jgi:hypothetical protein
MVAVRRFLFRLGFGGSAGESHADFRNSGNHDENATIPAIIFDGRSGTLPPRPALPIDVPQGSEGFMPTARYFIVHDQVQDEWMIKYGDDEFGPYKTQDEAMLFAIDAAQKLGTYGESAEVCLMGENGHFHAEWVAGRDHQLHSVRA